MVLRWSGPGDGGGRGLTVRISLCTLRPLPLWFSVTGHCWLVTGVAKGFSSGKSLVVYES